jgi:SET domain-containing protein
LWFGPSNYEELGIAERINHSCQPNCGFQSRGAATYRVG